MSSQLSKLICKICLIEKDITEFYPKYDNKKWNPSYCKKCANKRTCKSVMKRFHTNPQFRLHRSTIKSASARGIHHNLQMSDIPLPEYCAYLGIKLDYSMSTEHRNLRKDNGPSVDRKDNTKGYTVDNIQVISDLANRMKQNATNDQLIEFAKSIIRMNEYEFQE